MSSNAAPIVRDVRSLVLPTIGKVVETTDLTLPWRVVALPGSGDVAAIDGFLRDLVACDNSRLTIRSYAFALLRWWRFVDAIGQNWGKACRRQDVRDLVLWLRQARDGAGYAAATINHQLSVISVFHDHLAERGEGPVLKAVPTTPGRRHAHHNPLEPFHPPRRAPYRQRDRDVPGKALSDDLVDRLFTRLTSNRDRAIVAIYVASGDSVLPSTARRPLSVTRGRFGDTGRGGLVSRLVMSCSTRFSHGQADR